MVEAAPRSAYRATTMPSSCAPSKAIRSATRTGWPRAFSRSRRCPDEARAEFKSGAIAFIDGLVSHLWLYGGRLCAAHAGMKEEYIGPASGRVRDFALYGETSGETDESGLPVRYPWAQDYRGAATSSSTGTLP